MRNAYLIGPRLYLRAIEDADAAECAPWFSDPDVRRTLQLRARPNTEVVSRQFIQQLDPAFDQVFAMVTRNDDTYIGNCGLQGLDPVNRVAELGIAIGRKERWGQGYGTEAVWLLCRHGFDTLNLHRIWLRVYAINARALAVYERLGFQTEGRLRGHAFIDGAYVDEVLMGLLAGELRDPSSARRATARGARASRPTRRRRG